MPDLAVAAGDRTSPGAPSPHDVRDELERILSSASFPASPKRRAFLRFVVDETLSGRGDRLKGYSIAAAVFGRDETFDAQADPVVRLEARRLRRDLDCYYVDAGSRDPVRISIPKGSYAPRFERHEAVLLPPSQPADREAGVEEPKRSSDPEGQPDADTRGVSASLGKLVKAGMALAVMAGVAAAGWMLVTGQEQSPSSAVSESSNGPAVVVLPFAAIGSTEYSQYLARGISEELISDLMRFPHFRIYTSLINLTGNSTSEPAKAGRDLGVAYVVAGSVRDNANTVRVTAKVVEASTARVLWVKTYDRPLVPEALIRAERDLSGEIATAIGQPYGIVNTDLNEQSATPAVSNMGSYVCVLRAYGYRRGFERNQFDRVLACLEEAVRLDPKYGDAWAMLGWLHLDAGRLAFTGDGNRQEEYRIALKDTSKAVELDPNNTLALKALAAVNHYLGRYDESERLMHRALQLNPYDPNAMALLGWRLAVRGKFDQGIPLLKQAIDRTVNPPPWYFTLIAIDLYLKGDYEKMLQAAERAGTTGTGFGQTLIAIAAGKLGKRELAQTVLKNMSKYTPLSTDPAAFMRTHGATDEIVTALMAGLAEARRVASASK